MVALAEVWRAPRGRELAGELVHSLEMLYDIIERPEGGGSSAYKGAVKQALDVAAALNTAGKNLPSVEQWRRFRAAASGAHPAPTQRERAATRARMAATGYATNAARKASKTITWTAIEWRKTNAPARDTSGGAPSGGQGDAEPSIRVVVAGSRRAETRDTGADRVPRPLPVNIMRGTGLGNPFPMGKRGTDEALRDQIHASAHPTGQRAALLAGEIAPRRSDEARTGNDAVVAMRAALNGRGNAKVVRLGCSPSC
ncbi:hypothetical protein EMIHUDRAFT_218399 [Emiliania huxleyi CCMP1516]|uniref:Uncharacterized protein n=2 Tax=Emiliania huxleyi TaxID=2903 RepID=A0A0D3I882_EMIH1|nr:hypothetical protein EMIHUDRAFT_218399 [Emiliania huxleyi CCMP1516]EOD07467.1 hypothetical protein EMIHUDRAFT_218399 [Emiliania huxleyi CCMP1516]|eukprot:XP_005759896.1 hypothetical protein EMIHUDRAFT_218399 [Emiliania huxleyi CCMP1516]